MKYLLFSLLTFFAGSISNFALAPWDYIFVLLFSFPLFFFVLQDIYNEKKIKNKTLYFILFGNIFLFGYFLFGLLWISSAFDYREGFAELKFISIFRLSFSNIFCTLFQLQQLLQTKWRICTNYLHLLNQETQTQDEV